MRYQRIGPSAMSVANGPPAVVLGNGWGTGPPTMKPVSPVEAEAVATDQAASPRAMRMMPATRRIGCTGCSNPLQVRGVRRGPTIVHMIGRSRFSRPTVFTMVAR